MLINEFNTKQLKEAFEVCVTPQRSTGKHGYLGYRVIHDNTPRRKVFAQTFESKKAMEDAGYRKMSIPFIQEFCHLALCNKEGLVPKEVLQSLHKISENRNSKLNTLAKRVARFFLSVLKYVLCLTLIGIPFALMIQRKQYEWKQLQLQTYKFLKLTVAGETVIDSSIKKWNSKPTQVQLHNITSEGIKDDLKLHLVSGDCLENCRLPVVLESLWRDHTRGSIANYSLEDEETGYRQRINPLSSRGSRSGKEHFSRVLNKIEEFSDQGNLEKYCPYIQALMCQNILQAFLFLQKSELNAGSWRLEDSSTEVKPDHSRLHPCEIEPVEIKITLKKQKGSNNRMIHVEGTTRLRGHLISSRKFDSEDEKSIDFQESSIFLRDKISFDLEPKDLELASFSLKKFFVQTEKILD